MRKKIMFFLLCCAMITGNAALYAQKTSFYQSPLITYRDAIELFNKEKFGAAQEKFKQLLGIKYYPTEMRANAAYYNAICGLKLFNADAENLAMAFIKAYPENPKTNITYFQLADYYFKSKKYDEALKAYEKTNSEQLSAENLAEYKFKSGYCYFTQQDYDKAKKAFFDIIDKESKYYAPANYYFAHIAYTEKNYETALKSFRKLQADEAYSKIAPFYMIQIYYYQQKYDEVTALAPALLADSNNRRYPEISRIAAEAYYQTERYSEAIPYLENYLQRNTTPMSLQDYYMAGFTYFKTGNYNQAIDNFKKISTAENDSLTQLTCYHLAECYLATEQKQFAINMFSAAYKMDFDKDVQENAMFSYAKLSYETGYNPYNESINVFNEYIDKYPNSSNLDEAYEYLSNIYLSTKNYNYALASLEKIKKRDLKLNTAYQKIAYLRGIELFNNSDFGQSIALFNKSLKYPVNQNLEIQSYFWSAEAYYRMEKYDSALINYQLLQSIPGAYGNEAYLNSYYGMGYSNFKNAITHPALPISESMPPKQKTLLKKH
ncbi:MAG: tetratricopeptide repeat protein [Bacteroidales bacterium]|nr:tetratricopeptide repeat protein [Bacteroidales bacterium]